MLSLISAACGTGTGGGDTDQGSATTLLSTTSTTTGAKATTTTAAGPCAGEPISIDQQGGRLLPGCIHITEEFAPTLLTFTTDGDSWLTFADGDPRLARLGIDVNADGGLDASIAFLVWNSHLEPEQIFEELDAIEGVELQSPTSAATLGGRPAVVADFLAAEDPGMGFQPGDVRACTSTGLQFSSDEPGYQLITYFDRQDVGFPACNTTRVWAVQDGEETFLVLAAANDPDQFDELLVILEEFLESGVTFGDSDG